MDAILHALNVFQPIAVVAIGVISAYYGLRSYQLSRKIDRVQFLSDTVKFFLSQDTSHAFWKEEDADEGAAAVRSIDVTDARGSKQEIEVEVLLFRIGSLGRLLREHAFGIDELETLYAVCRRIFVSRGIRNYLRIRQLLIFRSDGGAELQFPDAVYLYERLTRAEVAAKRAPSTDLKSCVDFIAELRAIPYSPALREHIASGEKHRPAPAHR